MAYTIITTIEELYALQPAWERLEALIPHLTFYSSFQYAKTIWEQYDKYDKYELWTLCIEHNGMIIGIAPLMIEKSQNRFLKWNTLKLFAVGDYGDFLVDTNSEVKQNNIYKEMFKAIEDNSVLWDEISITHLNYKSNLVLYLLSSAFNKHTLYLTENPFVEMSKIFNDNEYNTAILPNKVRQYANRLKKQTNYESYVIREFLYEPFSTIHIAEKEYLHSIGSIHRHSLFEDEERSSQYEALFQLPETVSYYLFDKVNQTIIMFNSGFIYKNVFHSIVTALNPAYEKFGVGKIMYYELFLENSKNPLWSELDAGTGRYQWKFEWATGFNLLYQLQYTNPSSKKLIRWKKLQNLKKVLKNV